jgi:SAM-dependent methyltransferase
VWINRRYLDADLRILTGLVEPHFMAGASGGPKSICPGIAGHAVTHSFHGANMMAHERAASLVLDGNPCHEESNAVAAMAGCDFAVNVTLNRERRVTGVFAGEITAVHRAAVAKLLQASAIHIEQTYDLVVTHAGFVGINHYQAAKAAVEASRAVRPGGRMVLAANHTDADPVGSTSYRRLLPLLREHGAQGFERHIRGPDWLFAPDQWEVQMWGRVFRRLGDFTNLVYCAPQLTGEAFRRAAIPALDGGAGVAGLRGRDLAEAMVQLAIDGILTAFPATRMAVLLDGPYGVPIASV